MGINGGFIIKITGKYLKHLFNLKQQAELTFLIENYRYSNFLIELETDVEYKLEITKVKSQRSIQANKYMWAMLHQLEKVTRELAMDWYIKALVDTGAVVDYIWCAERTENTVMKSFRAIQKMKYEKMKNVDGYWYRVIVGSSKYNVSEMNELIETVLRYCTEHNIQTDMFDYE